MPDYLNIARRALESPAVSESHPFPGGAAKEAVNSSQAHPITAQEAGSLESVLKGRVIELWSTRAGRLFIVADDEDAALLAERRGIVYTAAEVRRIVRIDDPE